MPSKPRAMSSTTPFLSGTLIEVIVAPYVMTCKSFVNADENQVKHSGGVVKVELSINSTATTLGKLSSAYVHLNVLRYATNKSCTSCKDLIVSQNDFLCTN